MTIDGLLGGLGSALLLLGLALATIGLFGLLLKPDIFDQLHVAGLITGSGVILVLLASIGTGNAEIVTSALLVVAFVLVTSSISTHAIAYAGVRRYAPATEPERSADLGTVDQHREPSAGMRVLLAHDGSPAAEVAARLVAAIDWPVGTVVRRLEVAPADVQREAAGGASGPSASGTDGGPLATIMRAGVRVETVIAHGDPADVIVEAAASFGADLLVTGARRRGRVQSLLGISAAGEIVDRAPCPVLVARSEALRTVLLTTDGSAQSAAATDVVARWPIFDLARIFVVTVAAGTTPTAGEHRTVGHTAAQLMDAGRDVVTSIIAGRPGPAIVEAARGWAVDLVVIGTRGRIGLGRTLLGSVTGEVLAQAGSSVLVVGPTPRRRSAVDAKAAHRRPAPDAGPARSPATKQ